jgi:hypothetical protein
MTSARGRYALAFELARLVAELLDAHPGRFAVANVETDGPLFAKVEVVDVGDGTRFMLVVEEVF